MTEPSFKYTDTLIRERGTGWEGGGREGVIFY